LLADAGVKLPSWVKQPASDKQKTIRHAEKLRRNQLKEEVVEDPAIEEVPAEAPVAEEAPAEAETADAE
jgi:hypothetical protein